MSERFERMNNIAPIRHQHPKGMCYIHDAVIFLPIPKNASTSLRNMIDFESRRGNIMSFRRELEEEAYKAFAIIRDPLSRFVSGYLEVCKRAGEDSPHILSTEFYWLKGRDRFVKFLDEVEEGWFDAHLFPQRYFLCDYEGNPFMIHAYADMKQLSTALPALLDRFGMRQNASVPRLNASDGRARANTFRRRWNTLCSMSSHPRRGLYQMMDYTVRRLQRKPLPTSAEVYGYLREDSRLQSRVEHLLAEDVAFLDDLKKKMVADPSGFYWRSNAN